MSEKGLLYKKRKNNHGSHGYGSGFPRAKVDKYQGTRLGMKKTHMFAEGNWYLGNYGYVRGKRIEKIIIQYIGKPYKDLEKAYLAMTKKLRDKNLPNTGLSKLKGYFYCHNLRYIIDKKGLVQRKSTKPYTHLKLTKTQINHNRSVVIPDFGITKSIPRAYEDYENSKYDFYNFSINNTNYINTAKGGPKLIGNYWCIIKENVFYLPVYHLPYAKDFLKYQISDEFTHYLTTNKLSEFYGKDSPNYKRALYMEKNWIIPFIPFSRGSYFHQRPGDLSHLRRFRNDHYVDVTDRKKDRERVEIEMKVNILYEELTNNHFKEEFILNRIKDYKNDLKRPKTFIKINLGEGQLYPVVKMSDYQKACERIL